MPSLFARAALAAAAAMALAGSAAAAPIFTATFDTGAEGFQLGPFQTMGVGAAPWNAGGFLETGDVHPYNAFQAPTAWLGDRSGAFGGQVQFDMYSCCNDLLAYAPLTLISGSTILWAAPAGVPSTNFNAPTTYAITLVGASFRTADLGGGSVVSDATLQAVLGNLTGIGFNGDWHTGGDYVTLDNVAFCTTGGCDAVQTVVPEPTTWALMILGFGGAGAALRRARLPRLVHQL